MLLRIMSRLGVSGEETLFVGDLPTDREAAGRAGVHFMWANEFFHNYKGSRHSENGLHERLSLK